MRWTRDKTEKMFAKIYASNEFKVSYCTFCAVEAICEAMYEQGITKAELAKKLRTSVKKLNSRVFGRASEEIPISDFVWIARPLGLIPKIIFERENNGQ